MNQDEPTGGSPDDHAVQKSPAKDPLFLVEFWQFIRDEKRWVLVPMLISFLILSGLALFALSPVAPFIYTLF
ncbi:MAG: DUF5989 family protein [Planctomycetota bacterium]